MPQIPIATGLPPLGFTYDSAMHAIRGLKDKFGEIPFNYLPGLIYCMVPVQNHHLNCKFNEITSDTRSVVCV